MEMRFLNHSILKHLYLTSAFLYTLIQIYLLGAYFIFEKISQLECICKFDFFPKIESMGKISNRVFRNRLLTEILNFQPDLICQRIDKNQTTADCRLMVDEGERGVSTESVLQSYKITQSFRNRLKLAADLIFLSGDNLGSKFTYGEI